MSEFTRQDPLSDPKFKSQPPNESEHPACPPTASSAAEPLGLYGQDGKATLAADAPNLYSSHKSARRASSSLSFFNPESQRDPEKLPSKIGKELGSRRSAVSLASPKAKNQASGPGSPALPEEEMSLPLAADSARSEPGTFLDFTAKMKLKSGHTSKPLIVCPNGHIYMEVLHPLSSKIADFVIAIAEPVSRPEKIHEFQITVFSLYAAIGIGITVDEIQTKLEDYSKNKLAPELLSLIQHHCKSFGRLKIILRDNRYYMEAATKEDLEYMLSDPIIAENRIRNSMTTRIIRSKPDNLSDSSAKESTETVKQIYIFEVKADQVTRIKESALTYLKRPLVSEYEFLRDHKNPKLEIALKPTTKIRYYQEQALRKMFTNGRARSGIIVLPCGAGKTLTGITAATTIRRSAIVLTSSSVAVDQWKRAFFEFAVVDPAVVLTLTSDQKCDLPEGVGVILISTYTMMAYSGKRSAAAERVLKQIHQREWGLLIFDEVQYAPAPAFRKINDTILSHCKLGLTATLVREDDLIIDLQWLIGPKLYEANWLELQQAGFLAKVQVSEVWCPMTADFYREYLSQNSHAKQRNLWVCNPNKLRVCEYLIRFHESRNDKIIVFSDNLFALKETAMTLKKPFISGEVSIQERMLVLNHFKSSNKVNTIFLSKVGDNTIDIPCANVVIQISFNFASRRQEAQRLGRILRPKPKLNEDFNAFFYSLISKDTQEMLYADKRQQFIIDQGYAYKILPITVFPMEEEDLLYDSPERAKELLRKIRASSDQYWAAEVDEVALQDSTAVISQEPTPDMAQMKTITTRLSTMTGTEPKSVYRETPYRANP